MAGGAYIKRYWLSTYSARTTNDQESKYRSSEAFRSSSRKSNESELLIKPPSFPPNFPPPISFLDHDKKEA